MLTPPPGDTWTALTSEELPVNEASAWAVTPRCGAVVVFNGTSRDHSADRPGVSTLEFEAYEEQVVPRLDRLADAMRQRWPDVERIVLIHRVGEVPIEQSAVIVAASSPHRDSAFEAARYGIDTLKTTVPIWKKEDWDGGSSWGLEPQHITDVGSEEVPTP